MLKNGFLVVVASFALHQTTTMIVSVLAGYIALGFVDRYLLQKKRNARFADEFEGWAQDPQDKTYESKGVLTRMHLEPPHSVVVRRIAELLRWGMQ
jgi:hypothetical protein